MIIMVSCKLVCYMDSVAAHFIVKYVLFVFFQLVNSIIQVISPDTKIFRFALDTPEHTFGHAVGRLRGNVCRICLCNILKIIS